MSSIQTESLENRMERIRLKNEEIEKKHREAMEDKLAAQKNNAMVSIKPSDDDWPRKHKYDTEDFPYDDDTDGEKIRPQLTAQPTRKEHKKFADGQGPPPDPVYNFLADAERDGTPQQNPGNPRDIPRNAEKNIGWKQPSGGGGYRNRNGVAGGSFRQNKGKPRDQRFERQKSTGDVKWKGPQIQQRPMAAPINLSPPMNAGELVMTEKRGNITISVSQDGEIKSVKLATAPSVPGSGRVGMQRPAGMMTKQQPQVFANPSPLHNNPSQTLHKQQLFNSQPPMPLHYPYAEHHQPQPIVKTSSVQSRLERNRQIAAGTITAEN
ncbi:hypothetical protein DMENIID0001_123440 [Sergentomyia squamirostris]